MRQMKVGSSSPLGQSSNSFSRIYMFSWESMDMIRYMCYLLLFYFQKMWRFKLKYSTISATEPRLIRKLELQEIKVLSMREYRDAQEIKEFISESLEKCKIVRTDWIMLINLETNITFEKLEKMYRIDCHNFISCCSILIEIQSFIHLHIESSWTICLSAFKQFIIVPMGSCISQSPNSRPSNPRPLSYNPINKILNDYSIEKLRQKWNRNQLTIIESKISAFEKNLIAFEDFCQLFPKIRHFKQSTQQKIYQLFAYEGNSRLSKGELINSLTLIRKVTIKAYFAPFIFYIYTQDPKHEKITTDEFALFEQENRSFLQEEIKSEIDLEKTGDMKGQQLQQTIRNDKSVRVKMMLDKFTQVFEKYSLNAYQHLFSWDLTEDEKELVALIQKEGMQRKKGERVFLLEMQWFLEWKAYVEYKFKTIIEIEDNINPYSKMTRKSKRTSTASDQNIRIDPPGEIKNYILKGSRLQGQLAEGMRENSNFVCLSESVWAKLVALYRGGPPIERIFPKIYDNTILKVFLDEYGKFIPKKMEKFTSTDHKFVDEYADDFQFENKSICFYKYPGKSNWIRLKNPNLAQSQDIFNCSRSYLLFVLPQYVKKFDLDYNIQQLNKEQRLRRRLKNYGAEVNVSIQGVLTRAEVVDILDDEEIVVQYTDESGRTQRQTFKIDQKLRHLNPQNLSTENQLNQLSGLTNIGNTCYMNAIIQCLLRTPSFGGYLQNENFSSKDEKDEDLLLKELANIWQQSKNNNHQTISTKTFKKIFDKHCPFFQGNSQHDAQEFLICLLSRISEQIQAKRTEYGQRQSTLEEQKNVNKKVVKFFSGQTEATTECLKCKNKGIRKEPFFTYSVSLPEHSDVQYSYFLVEKDSNQPLPVRYGITLHRKTTIEQFLAAVCKRHKKKEDNIFLYSVFNNELLNRLDSYTFQKEIGHHLNFNTQLVLFQVQYRYTPTFDDYRLKDLRDKSVKIELRQRIYSSKTSDYKIIHLPYLLQIKEKMTWTDVINDIKHLISKSNQNINQNKQQEILESGQSLMGSPLRVSEIKFTTNSRDTNTQGDFGQKSNVMPSASKLTSKLSSPEKHESLEKKASIYKENVDYKIRVIKSDHYYDNNCVFCKEQFVLDSKSRRKQICKGCNFESQQELFKSTDFRNINDNIIVAIDWLNAIPNSQQFVNHPSYEESQAKSVNRRDRLQDLLVASANIRQNLDLRCQKVQCKFQQAVRWQRIIIAPNILLLHFKRFTYQDNMLLKLTNNVVYPSQLTLPGTSEKYELYGSVVHIGSGVGGHYISYVKVAQKWYRCDDSKVTLASSGQQIDPNAYLLFYKKVDFEPSLICLSF